MNDAIDDLIRNRYREQYAEDGTLLSVYVYDEHSDKWISLIRWVPDLPPPGVIVGDVTVTFGPIDSGETEDAAE